MKALTRLQVLEKQNREYRTHLENRAGKAELAMIAMENEYERVKGQLSESYGVIAMLQAEIGVLTRELEAAKAVHVETVQCRIDAAVAEAAVPLLEELGKAHNEISRLKAIINKDSSNSSKPPRTNGYKKIPNSREKSGRARGGQAGHPGHRLGLPDNMDELVAMGIVKKQLVPPNTLRMAHSSSIRRRGKVIVPPCARTAAKWRRSTR